MYNRLLLVLVLLISSFTLSAQVTVSLGTATGAGSTNVLLSTSTTSNRYSRTMSLYTAAEIITAGGSAGTITSLAWDKQGTGEYASANAYIKVSLKHVTNTAWSTSPVPDWTVETTGATDVFTSTTYSIPTGTGWKQVVFTTPFVWNGTDNIAVMVEWDRSSAPTGDISWGRSTNTNANATRVGSTSLAALVMLVNSNRPLLQLTFSGGGTAPACVTTPTAPANAGTICAGSTTLSWPAVTGATSYDVYLNTGTTATTLVSGNQSGTSYTTTLAAGSYAWRVVPKNSTGSATGCATFTFTANAAVTPAVSISASPSGTVCSGRTVTFTATPTNGGTTPAYQWKKGTVNVGTNAPTYTDNTLTGTDVISVVMTSNAACPATATATSNNITMSVSPSPTAAISPSSTVLCNGGTITLNANTGTGLTYRWQLNNTTLPGATGATYTASTAGIYRVLVSNGTCDDTSASITLTSSAGLIASITPTGAATVCQGSTILLSGPAAAPGVTYTWLLNGAVIPAANSNTYAAGAAGNYKLVLSNGSCTDTSAVTSVTVNPAPVATATAAGPTSFCTGGSVVLNGNSAAGMSYQWLRNNAVITGATTNSYTATTSGVYMMIIRNTVTGCADTTDPGIPVLVSTAPGNNLTASGALTFCEGSNVILQAAAGTGFTYTWHRNNVVIAGATGSSYTASTAGIYHAVVTNGACVTTTVTRTISVNPLPAAAITSAGPTDFCNGGSVVLNANTGAGLTYQWRLNNTINIAGATSPAYTATTSGNYSVVVSNGSCTNTSNSITVNVNTVPAPVITAVGVPSFCQGGSVMLNANTAPGYTYQWKLNNNDITGATTSSYNATAAGQYTVVITNGACVATSMPFTVSVTPAPTAVITPSGPTAICQGNSVLLHASRGTGYTYQWTRNGINLPGATSWQYTAASSGDYAVDVFDGSCPATSAQVTVTVGAIPVATITVTGGTTLSTGTFSAYQWYRNGLIIPGAIAQTYTAIRDGYYAVVVTDNAGCTATSTVQQISALDVAHTVPSAMTVKVWPNPATDQLQVETPGVIDMSLRSIDGKELIRTSEVKQMNISILPQGVYLLHVHDHKSGTLISVQRVTKR